MRLITAKTVAAFAQDHADARQGLSDWVAIVKNARWTSPVDLQRSVPGARPISDKRVVFNIQGNKFRIVCDVQYADDRHNGIVRVQFIGTHAEYDKIDAMTVTLRPTDS
ncbi:MAG: type II toxin-antitoxin system HigB family toxin [Alphaproteobacteria bacterium]|nr:type II toxin-antitoxin system HigB family toxin [Alphaproteobacteria bacterium]